MKEIWTEYYRPNKLKEVVGQKNIIYCLEKYLFYKNIPHLIFHGPPGVGKTTCALAIAKEIYKEEWQRNFIELNASDERGIDVVRGKIKEFSRIKPIGDFNFKIIFMDEADSLTIEAQSALRRTMETYAEITRFIFSCNTLTKIINPIQSRCVIFNFEPINLIDEKNYLLKICSVEGISITDDALKELISNSEGDMRKAINFLQLASNTNKNITKDILHEIIKEINPDIIKSMINKSLNGNFLSARKDLENLILEQGLSGLDILKKIFNELLSMNFKDSDMLELIDKLGEIEFRLIEGSNEKLQLEVFLAFLTKYKII